MRLILLVFCLFVTNIAEAREVQISWTNAKHTEERTSYENPKSTRVWVGDTSRELEEFTGYAKQIDVPHPKNCVILNLEPGTWFVTAEHESEDGDRSRLSSELRLVIETKAKIDNKSKKERRKERKKNRKKRSKQKLRC